MYLLCGLINVLVLRLLSLFIVLELVLRVWRCSLPCFCVLCNCSCLLFLVLFIEYVSLFWPSRKTSPIPPMNQSSLEMVVRCVCSLFFNLFFVFDVVLCFCRWCRALCSCPLSLALVSFLLFVLCPWAVFGFGNQIESKEQEQRNKSNNNYNEQNHSQPIKPPHQERLINIKEHNQQPNL